MTDDPVAKARALESHAVAKSAAAKSLVRFLSPDTADFLNAVGAVFGRPAAVEVRDLDSGSVVFSAGRFGDEGCPDIEKRYAAQAKRALDDAMQKAAQRVRGEAMERQDRERKVTTKRGKR